MDLDLRHGAVQPADASRRTGAHGGAEFLRGIHAFVGVSGYPALCAGAAAYEVRDDLRAFLRLRFRRGRHCVGTLADRFGIEAVYNFCAYTPLLGMVAAFLPDLRKKHGRQG